MSIELSPVELKVEEMTTEKWSWSTSPVTAIGHCSTSAATAAGNGHRDQARFWTLVGLALCEEAGIAPGAVLEDLRDNYAL